MQPSHTFLGRLAIALVLGCAPAATGCNGVLGIEAPEDTSVLDGGRARDGDEPQPADRDAASDHERDAGDADLPEVELDAGGGVVVEPSDPRFPTWPMPNPPSTGAGRAQSYTASPDGFVTDEVTRLEWQQSVDDRASSWKDAAAYCEALDLGGGGFRLPTRIELLSLLDFTAASPTIDGAAFPDTPADYYWSASSFVGDRSIAWLVSFGAAPGFLSSTALDSVYRVRCVRETVDPEKRKLTIDEGAVKDTATQLTWQRTEPQDVYAFDAAGKYCGELDLGGKGWRLPTIKELQTLIDETRSMPAIDGAAFPKTATDFYWTASAVAGSEGQAWAVSFRFGFDGAFEAKTKQHVRCVR